MIVENTSILTQNRIAAVILILLQITMIVCYGIFMRYQQTYPNQEDLQIAVGLCILVLIGFGLIMSYLKDAGLSGMGFTLLIAAIVFQLFFLINCFWTKAAIQQTTTIFGDSNHQYSGIVLGENTVDTPVNVFPYTTMIKQTVPTKDSTVWAAFKCALAMIVGFSALLGRAGPLQISIMVPIGTIVYELNSQLMSRFASDSGSSMRVFLFGGFFGFVCSWAMRNAFNTTHPTFIRYSSSKFNALLALIGSIFCFVLFPFLSQQRNFTNVQLPILNYMKFACTINVILSITSSLIVSTVVSLFFQLKIGIKDFIFASIAGGIAIGSSSDLITNPAASLVVGAFAGFIQVMWNRFIEKHINKVSIIDSLNCLGLFGITGFQAGFWSAIFSAFQSGETTKSIFLANVPGSPNNFQMKVHTGGQQIGALFMTLGIASVAGAIVGWILFFINKNQAGFQFSDSTYWVTEDDGIHYKDIHQFNMSSNISNQTGGSLPITMNIAPPEVVLPMGTISPIVRPGGNIIGPCSYL